MAWNSWLTYRLVNNPSDENNESVSNPDTMIVNHTINGYTTDITETVKKVQSRVVSVLATVDERTVTGSGVVYHSSENDCYILASYTTVQNSSEIEVRLDSGVKLPAELVGGDEKTDIALLLIHPEFMVEPIDFGDSDIVKQGEYVISLSGRTPSTGNGSVGFGVVSFLAQIYREFTDEEVGWIASTLFTDIYAVDNNVGGALVNLNGDLIGLMTRRATTVDSNSRLVSAIASNEVQIVVDQLLSEKSVTRGFLGMIGRNVSDLELYEKSAYNLTLDNYDGVLVTEVIADSPAFQAGIQEGDILLLVNDIEIKTVADLRALTYQIHPEDVVTVIVNRRGNTETMSVTVR